MKRFLFTLLLTLATLLVIDFGVAGLLGVLERSGKIGSLVRFFDYGRSVPGKHTEWLGDLDQPHNPMKAAWIDQMLQDPITSEPPEGADRSLIIRSYGMSFSNNILLAALDRDASLTLDLHAGPASPPNSSFYVALADRENREPNDVVVLAFLSSSLRGMQSLSNRTWNFEQPIPYTYPIYRAVEGELIVTHPIVTTLDEELNPVLAALWKNQLSNLDANYSGYAFEWPTLDYSPFVRLVRRALAIRAQTKAKSRVETENNSSIRDTLRLIIRDFAEMAREDGQLPVIFLIQSRDPSDLNLLAMLRTTLENYDVPYMATEDHFPPTDLSGFEGDGHYRPEVDDLFAQKFLEILAEHNPTP